jgi:hypothetical protein
MVIARKEDELMTPPTAEQVIVVTGASPREGKKP